MTNEIASACLLSTQSNTIQVQTEPLPPTLPFFTQHQNRRFTLVVVLVQVYQAVWLLVLVTET